MAASGFIAKDSVVCLRQPGWDLPVGALQCLVPAFGAERENENVCVLP